MNQSFKPETYMIKAEEDIRRAQLQASLAEPPWDGHCGIVKVCDEGVFQPSMELKDQSESLDSENQSQGSRAQNPHSSSKKPDKKRELAKSKGESTTDQNKAVKDIMRQIKSISRLPEAERAKNLEELAAKALESAKSSDRGTSQQLLKLADFACPEKAVELKASIRAALKA